MDLKIEVLIIKKGNRLETLKWNITDLQVKRKEN
jgi:hypothetical protein